MVTTIKLKEETKAYLNACKQGNETYDEIVSRLAQADATKQLTERLAEGYKKIKMDKERQEWESLQ